MPANRSSAIALVAFKSITFLFSVFLLMLGGCSSMWTSLNQTNQKLYQSGTAYIYQPLNPTTVWIRDPTAKEQKKGWMDGDETSEDFKKALLRDLDTETVRISLANLSGDSKSSVGLVGVSVAGQSYVLIVDYIKYLTEKKEVNVSYKVIDAKGKEQMKAFREVIPMYVGVGLRIRAEFRALKSGLNVSGLPALAIAANMNGINGRLTVQTLGITGREVSNLMPLISDISVTSIQSAVQAVAAIKAKIYDTKETTIYPKIVGFESPKADPELIRSLTKALYESNEYICPVVSEIPNTEGKKRKVFWIKWPSPPHDDCKETLPEDKSI